MTARWERIAHWPGGTVAALAAVGGPDGAGPILAATAAGVHTSSDGGQRWQWVGLGPAPVPEALAVSPAFASDRTVLLGATTGLFRSTDGGRRWQPTLIGSRVQAIAAATDFALGGVVLTGTESDGILRSEDGGRGWLGANAGLLDLNVTALALSPDFTQDRTAFAGTVSGLYRSRNGGRAWRLVELGVEAPVVQAIAVSPAFEEDGLVLAGTESDGLFRSDDGGQTWESVDGFPGPCVTGLAFGQPGDAQRIVAAGTAAGLAISMDGGATWTLDAPELGPVLGLAIIGDGNGAAILAGTIGSGIVRREMNGSNWEPANHGLHGRATVDLAVSTAYGPTPLIAVASLDAGVLLSHDGGETWATGSDGLTDLAATSVAIVKTTSGQPALLATFPDGVYRSLDMRTGWHPISVSGGERGDRPAPPSRVMVLGGAGPASSLALAAGPKLLALSDDGGDSWRALPLPSPNAELVSAAASPDLLRDGTLYAVVRATRVERDGSVVDAGRDLWQTADFGKRWSRWLDSPTATVMPLAVPRPGDLEASVLVGHVGRVARPLPRSQEVRGGERRPLWLACQIGNPSSAITAIAISPDVRRDGALLAASDNAVYLSRDGGATFGAWDAGLDVPMVTGLSLIRAQDGHLTAYVLGLGGTLWRQRVDLTPTPLL